MNYISIQNEDLLNGTGLRVSLWVAGCPHHCEGCHNPETWNERGGQAFTQDDLERLIDMLDSSDFEGRLSILGGEPLADYNYQDVLALCYQVRQAIPNANIWLWTGYTLEELHTTGKIDILGVVDVIIEGRYQKDKPTSKKWRGSDNQRMWVRGVGYVD